MMQRRHFSQFLLAAPFAAAACSAPPATKATAAKNGFSYLPGITDGIPLIAPVGRPIKVAFTINPGVQVIDVAGPWETFQDTYASTDVEAAAFEMFTVSDTITPVRASGGLMMVPDYSIQTAPIPIWSSYRISISRARFRGKYRPFIAGSSKRTSTRR